MLGASVNETFLTTGYNPVEIFLPKVDKPTEFKALIRVEGREVKEKTFTLSPVPVPLNPTALQPIASMANAFTGDSVTMSGLLSFFRADSVM